MSGSDSRVLPLASAMNRVCKVRGHADYGGRGGRGKRGLEGGLRGGRELHNDTCIRH